MSQLAAGTPAQFSLVVNVQPDVTTVRCSGRLMVESGDILRAEVHKLIKPGGRIVLDLTDVTHCDSMGWARSSACTFRRNLLAAGLSSSTWLKKSGSSSVWPICCPCLKRPPTAAVVCRKVRWNSYLLSLH